MSASIFEPADPRGAAPTRVVILHAAFTSPSDFVRHGFVRAVRERSLEVDLVFPGFGLEHVIDRSIFNRLQEEIIAPARALGCALWMGGISLGGYLALGCAERQPRELAGLCLLAPYLGSHLITGEIEQAQGVEDWQPGDPDPDDDERSIWRFIRTLKTRSLPVHLGLGREDRFSRRQELLAAALPPSSVDVVPGGHDWATWRILWDRFLEARLGRKGPGGEA